MKPKLIKNPGQMARLILAQKRRGKKIGLVPTMGYFHQGHLSLMRRARRGNDILVVSIFVNPAQFAPQEDFRGYPRDLRRDLRLAKEAGVDVVFYPRPRDMYPPDYQTYVEVEELTSVLCGLSRPGHFRGVTTVVAKLFNIVQPDVAYFGQKDAQQAIVIRRMVADLNLPLKIKILPIVRETDGLAMSSRNAYLSEKERTSALVLYRALQTAKKMIKSNLRDVRAIKTVVTQMIRKEKYTRIDYVAIVDRETLEPLKQLEGKALIALAVWVGKTRLIDNISVKVK